MGYVLEGSVNVPAPIGTVRGHFDAFIRQPASRYSRSMEEQGKRSIEVHTAAKSPNVFTVNETFHFSNGNEIRETSFELKRAGVDRTVIEYRSKVVLTGSLELRRSATRGYSLAVDRWSMRRMAAQLNRYVQKHTAIADQAQDLA